MAEKRTIFSGRIALSLSPAALIGGIISLCAGFVLVFSLGVLLGRGYNLEERIPKLERILPEPVTPMPPRIIAEDQSPPGPHANARSAADSRQTGVIYQGDLAFRENLRPPAPPPATPARQANQQPGTQGADPSPRPPDQDRERPPLPAASGDSQVYHYVYQVAAYRNEAPCLAFVYRLQRDGFRARMERTSSDGTTWYRTLIDFTGTPDDTVALREAITNYGVPRVILRSRTPAG